MVPLSPFSLKVIKSIKAIPAGKVATYKQIAALAGKPHGARGVAWILHSCSTKYKLPWHRVLNSMGRVSFDKNSHNYRVQIKRLRVEGIEISDEGRLELKKFAWSKKIPMRAKKNQPQLFQD